MRLRFPLASLIVAIHLLVLPGGASADFVELVPLELRSVSHTVCFDGVGSEAPPQCASGETSATLLSLLACGRPVLVTDQIHVRDLPDSVVARSLLEGDEDGLYCDLRDLIENERRRRELGESARRYAESEASPEAMAKDYLEAIEIEADL